MNSYKELIVWKKSMDLCVDIYKTTELFPKTEVYGLTSQLRRASVSIPSNIAEGQRRGHKNEYVQFLRIAYGSGAEVETQLLIALKIDYIKNKDFDTLISTLEEIMKMLNRMVQVLS